MGPLASYVVYHTELKTLLARLALALRADLDRLTEDVANLIAATISIYSHDGLVTREQLWASTHLNLGRIIDWLENPDVFNVESARLTGRSRAAQDVPLPEILRAFRLGFNHLWKALLAQARLEGPRESTLLIDAVTDIWALNDEYSTALTESYREEMTTRAVSLDRRRSGLVGALLDGTLGDQHTAWEISRMLGIPFEGTFLVVSAETSALDDRPLSQLEAHLRRRDIASAWRSQSDSDVGIVHWGRRRSSSDVLAIVSDVATTRIGVSPPFEGLDQMPRAARFAKAAMASLPAGTAAVNQLPDTPLSDLITNDPGGTRAFARRVLRSVLELPDDDRAVYLATAQAWLDARGSAVEAGRKLHCHENTVRYRIRRLEERLGTDLDDPLNLAELAAALQAVRTFPDLAIHQR